TPQVEPVVTVTAYDTQHLARQLTDGDLIFRRGRGWVSELILRLSPQRLALTHVGVVRRQGEAVFVQHIEDRGTDNDMQLDSLQEFLAQAMETVYVGRFDAVTAAA
ncbi:hypothetical protein RZS08_49410, partial [Arthrospira platensis SPKY1]|nr:hypothetical protein [Arthrospira platensis SPKY1]